MIFNKHVFLAILMVIYTTAFIATFDTLYDSVEISSIALVGLCGWFYGPRIGLFFIPFFILLNTFILMLVSGQPYDILLTYNPMGIIISMIMVIAIGLLKESFEQLRSLQASLDSKFEEATAELDTLALTLIENDERERIQMGQDLHDGVGQYLTGMLLHCESLSEELHEKKRAEAALAERMTQRIHTAIQALRQLSRTLLPIKFTETNIETALVEMTSFFSDASSIGFELNCIGNSNELPLHTEQHLYRIIHEAILCAIYEHHAKEIGIELTVEKSSYRVRVQETGFSTLPSDAPPLISEVMKYRAKTIGAKLDTSPLSKGGIQLECSASFDKETP